MARSSSAPLAAGLFAALALTAPADAQIAVPAALRAAGFAKSNAILGESSRLAAILSQQGGAPAIRLAAQAVQPASTGRPALTFAVVRYPVSSSDDQALTSGRPDVFGTVALSVGSTPLDARWRKVKVAAVHGAASSFATSLRDTGEWRKVEAVNWYVNKRVRFTDDQVQYGRADVWSSADQTLTRGRGDCEDYAIAKFQMLRAAGLADRDLYLVVLKDLVRRADHAVLVVRAAGRMLVLDNGTDEVLDTASVRDYRPILTFAAAGTWTHGYRIGRPSATMAALDPIAVPALAPAAQR